MSIPSSLCSPLNNTVPRTCEQPNPKKFRGRDAAYWVLGPSSGNSAMHCIMHGGSAQPHHQVVHQHFPSAFRKFSFLWSLQHPKCCMYPTVGEFIARGNRVTITG